MKRGLLNCLFIIVFLNFSWAQQVNLDHLKALKMRSIGPAGMSGRVTCIDVNINAPEEIIYVGTAAGGVWKSTSGGFNWEPIFDDQPVQSIGALAVSPHNPDEIWVGTGEGNPRNSHNSGEGIFKSIDGGKTWKMMGLKASKTIHRIIMDPDDPNTLYVGALGSIWGENEERGVFKTTDGGENWEKILYVHEGVGCADLVMDPNNPNKLIAAMWEFGRKPWFFNSGGKGSGMYLTYDGGKNWKKMTTKEGMPEGDIGRIGLAIAPSEPNIVYALIEAKENGLYRSTDGGETWSLRASKNIGNRPFYYADIFVDPVNENRIYNLHSIVTKSEDGGKTFETLLSYGYIHPDHHAFWVHPENPDYIIEGNDGGLNITHDRGKSWRFIENLPLAQFYHINYDMEIPYNVYGGLQDNGSWIGPAYVWHSGGIRNSDFQELLFGDGFDVVPRLDDSRYLYAMYQGGNVSYIDREVGKETYIQPFHPDGEELRFNWNAAIAADPFNNKGVYFGSQYLHHSKDCGQSWEILSPDLTTNDTSKQKQHLSGGLTIDNTRAENHTTITCIAPSSLDKDIIWVGTDDGNLQLTRDGGENWTNMANRLPDCPEGSYMYQIVASTFKKGEAFVVVNNYQRNDWRPMAYHTTNYGETWSRIAHEEQINGHAWAIVQDPVESSLLFLGTDFGLYVSFDYGLNWQKWMHNFPSAPARDLKIHPREHDLIVGTFGRAVFILDDIRPLREIAQTKGAVLEKPFRLFSPPTAYQANYASYEGTRYTGDAGFVGSNRPYGLAMTVWVNPDLKKKKKDEEEKTEEEEGKKKKGKGKKKDEGEDEMGEEEEEKPKTPKPAKDGKVKVLVLDTNGDTIRQYKTNIDTAMNRLYWGMSVTGVRYPSDREPKPDDNEPSGGILLPGKYQIKLFYGDFKDSTMATVESDPRLPFDRKKAVAKKAALEQYFELVDTARMAYDLLKDMEKTIGLTEKMLVNLPDSTKKEIKEDSKMLKDSLTTFKNLYRTPPGKKGIQRVDNTLNSNLYTVNSYIRNSEGEPNQMARYAWKKARIQTREVVGRINNFIEKEWKAYREKIENIEFSIFKEVESIKF